MRYRNDYEELVVAGLREPLSLAWLHSFFEFNLMDDAKAQQLTLDMIGHLVGRGLFLIGTPAPVGFHQWLMPLDEALAEISTTYVDHFSDRAGWAETIALYLTTKGRELGRTLDR